jgi:DNA-binding NarL/FixJ family response regulator
MKPTQESEGNPSEEIRPFATEKNPDSLGVFDEKNGTEPQVAAGHKRRIRVMIVDDHPIVREGVRRLLELEPDIELVAEAGSGREALETFETYQPDVLLLDLKLPDIDGMTVLESLRHRRGKSKILIFTASEDKTEWVQAMKLECSGIVVKQTSPELLVKSIRKVHEGEIWLDAHTTAAVVRQFASRDDGAPGGGARRREHPPLSAREREIVALVAKGYRNREMAEKLFISEQTVKNHLHNIFDKLGVSDRLELALYAIHKGIHLPSDD